MKDIREIANKVVELEVKINKRQEEMRLNGIELKKEDDEVKADNKKKDKVEVKKDNKKKDKEKDDEIIETSNKNKYERNGESRRGTSQGKEGRKFKKK